MNKPPLQLFKIVEQELAQRATNGSRIPLATVTCSCPANCKCETVYVSSGQCCGVNGTYKELRKYNEATCGGSSYLMDCVNGKYDTSYCYKP
jgi:hypothetical protein